MKNNEQKEVSKRDKELLINIRKNVSRFLKESSSKYDQAGSLLLDIAPQDHEGAAPYFKNTLIKTLDIDSRSGADFIADICKKNSNIIPNEYFDVVVCTEVIEHVLNPFKAISEIYRILKPGGVLLLSSPFGFRIHGPLPDCWRITEHGYRELLKEFSLIDIRILEDDKRFLMPIHHTIEAIK